MEKIEREDHGIPYHPEVLDWFKGICAELGIDWTLSQNKKNQRGYYEQKN